MLSVKVQSVPLTVATPTSTPSRNTCTSSVADRVAEMVPRISGVSSLVTPLAGIAPVTGARSSHAWVMVTVCVGGVVSRRIDQLFETVPWLFAPSMTTAE